MDIAHIYIANMQYISNYHAVYATQRLNLTRSHLPHNTPHSPIINITTSCKLHSCSDLYSFDYKLRPQLISTLNPRFQARRGGGERAWFQLFAHVLNLGDIPPLLCTIILVTLILSLRVTLFIDLL